MTDTSVPRTGALEQDELAADVHRALMDDVRPPTWHNPIPPGRYDFVVVGAGPGGLAAARGAAIRGAKVALIERELIGGDSLNAGSVPSKALVRTARIYADIRNTQSFGCLTPETITVDFPAAMARMRRIRARLSKAVSVSRLSEAGIDVHFGEARFSGRDMLMVSGVKIRFKKALIASGARALIASSAGLEDAGYLTNETVFDLSECPRRLLVLGGGPLGCELAQAFCRLGSYVVIVQDDPMFLPREERDAAQILSEALARDGVEVHLNTAVVAVRVVGTQKIVDMICAGEMFSVSVDEILVGIGRAPNVECLNLEAAGVLYDTEAGVKVDDFLRTSNPRVYAAGDVCLDLKFTHAAETSARIAMKNALFRGRGRLSAMTIPWCTYTDPEIAHVGLYVREAWEKSIPVETFTVLMHDVDRAVTDGEEEGFLKIHVRQGTDRILGATVVARHAGEMIGGLSLAISGRMGLRALARVVHAYPTQAEAIRMAAEAYDRARLTTVRGSLAKGL